MQTMLTLANVTPDPHSSYSCSHKLFGLHGHELVYNGNHNNGIVTFVCQNETVSESHHVQDKTANRVELSQGVM